MKRSKTYYLCEGARLGTADGYFVTTNTDRDTESEVRGAVPHGLYGKFRDGCGHGDEMLVLPNRYIEPYTVAELLTPDNDGGYRRSRVRIMGRYERDRFVIAPPTGGDGNVHWHVHPRAGDALIIEGAVAAFVVGTPREDHCLCVTAERMTKHLRRAIVHEKIA